MSLFRIEESPLLARAYRLISTIELDAIDVSSGEVLPQLLLLLTLFPCFEPGYLEPLG